jgi:XTP/dITP diphosphohydrolase/tetrapyrrole methylase family protein/MazG family protein/ATP diphosphatase
VADHCHAKLVRRHPHVFGEIQAETAGQVLRNWDAIKRAEPGREAGTFGDVPDNLPALLHARKVQRRAASTGFDLPGVDGPLAAVAGQLEDLAGAVAAAGADAERGAAARDDVRDGLFERVGDLLFAATNVARKLRVDPELALRSASGRFRARVEAAERLAGQAGQEWAALSTDAKISFYAHARSNETR